MTIHEIDTTIIFYQNRLFGLRVQLSDPHISLIEYNKYVGRICEIKDELANLNKMRSLKTQRKMKLEKIKDNEIDK